MVIGNPCKECGRPIVRRWPHELKTTVFCNNDCKFAYQRQHPANYQEKKQIGICQHCGSGFEYYPSVRPRAAYCSYACKAAEHHTKVSGKNSGTWKGNARGKVSARNLATRYFPQHCAKCGWAKASCDSHHIVSVSDGGVNNLSNLIVLCPNHHRMADEGMISIKELQFLWAEAYNHLSLPPEFLA